VGGCGPGGRLCLSWVPAVPRQPLSPQLPDAYQLPFALQREAAA